MLEQLEQVDGVKAAFVNHAGSLVRIELADAAEANDVAQTLTALLKKQNRAPRLLSIADADQAIDTEQWRERDRIGELSEIEFRTIFQRRIIEFVEEAGLDADAKAQLLEFAQRTLDETPGANSDTDWQQFCAGLVDRMLDKSKVVLTEQQLDELAKKLTARISG